MDAKRRVVGLRLVSSRPVAASYSLTSSFRKFRSRRYSAPSWERVIAPKYLPGFSQGRKRSKAGA
jgi:hypothetical protein